MTTYFKDASAVAATSISPNSGYTTGGETLTINGSNFSEQYCRDTSLYVQNGLIMHLDGIKNTSSGHSSSTTTWADLTGNNNNGTLMNFGAGAWADNHLVFNGSGGNSGPWVRLTRMEYSAMSIEAAIELHQYPSSETDSVGYNVLGNVDQGGSVLAIAQSGRAVHKATYSRSLGIFARYSTATSSSAIGLNQVRSLHGSYSSPTNTLVANGVTNTASATGSYYQPLNSTVWAIGTNPTGSSSSLYGNEQLFAGKVYSARIYNRILSSAEALHNQKVDLWRFGEKKENSCFTVKVDGESVPLTVVDSTSITVTMPPHAAGFVDVTVYNEFDEELMLTATYEYKDVATSYVNECRASASDAWTAHPYVPQGAAVECRIVLNGPFSGSISLADDYSETINENLSGAFTSSDPRFSSGVFTLDYADTGNTSGQSLYYTYTSPSSVVLEQYYAIDETDEERGDNGYDLYWPLIYVNVTPNYSAAGLTSSGDEVFLGLLAEKYYIIPVRSDATYCTNCSSTFTVSTRGAPYFGAVSLSELLTNSDNPGGPAGSFETNDESGDVIDFSELDGADTEFNYTPKTTATAPNYIRIAGTSFRPTIADTYIDIFVDQSGLTIVGPSSLKRGETGQYTLSVTLGSEWSGNVSLADVFGDNSLAGGIFVDTTSTSGLTNTYNPTTKTYSFSDSGSETYTRTFSYTLRNDNLVPPAFPSYQVEIKGVSSSPESTGWTTISVIADKLTIKCASGYPNCTTHYVGELKDYSIAPNGVMYGSANITDSSGGALGNNGAASWSSSTPFVISYTPASPGRKILTATVSSSSNADMIDVDYTSYGADSLDSYIYVMANSMAVSGYENLSSGQSGNYQLVMNGPFVGNISLVAYLNGDIDAGGVFSNGGVCSFSLSNYNPITNTTSCNFTYTPEIFNVRTTLRIVPSVATNYGHVVQSSAATVVVSPPLTIIEVAPDKGDNEGGTAITITGKGFLPYVNGQLVQCFAEGGLNCATVTLDIENTPSICTNAIVVDDNTITCTTTSHAASTVSVTVNNNLENHTKNNSFTYVALYLTVSSSETVIDITPGDGAQHMSNQLVVSTNNPSGYTMFIEMEGSEQRLVNVSASSYINATSGSWASPGTLDVNTWGFSIVGDDAFDNDRYAAVPPRGSPQIIRTTNSSASNEATTINFGANVGFLLPTGRYVGSIIYTVTAIN